MVSLRPLASDIRSTAPRLEHPITYRKKEPIQVVQHGCHCIPTVLHGILRPGFNVVPCQPLQSLGRTRF